MPFKPLDLPYRHAVYDGVPVPNFITEERMNEIKTGHNSRPDDVFISTFMKSGTTWLQYLVYEILGRPQGDYTQINQVVPWLEEERAALCDSLASPRIFKTHDRWSWVPKGKGVKYVYCYRNPKDVVVSYYHHQKMFSGHYEYEGCTISEFVQDVFLKYNCTEGGYYFDQVSEWLKLKGDPNIHFVTYEDMVEDLTREIKRLVKFLDVNLSEQRIEEISANGVFDSMKKDNRMNYSWREGSKIQGKSTFMRKGKVGDWVNHLTEEHSREIEALADKYLVPLGAKIRYTL